MKRTGLILIYVLSSIFLAAALSQAGQPDNYQENLKRWQEMRPEQREKIKEIFKEWKSLSPEEKEILKRRIVYGHNHWRL